MGTWPSDAPYSRVNPHMKEMEEEMRLTDAAIDRTVERLRAQRRRLEEAAKPEGADLHGGEKK